MNPREPIPLTVVDVNPDRASELVTSALRAGQLAQGPLTTRFENEFAAFINIEFAVAVSNATVALSAALLASGVEPGDEVITSPFTFAGTLNAIAAVGAVARLVDIGTDFCVDPAKVAEAISPRTKVLMPVHIYGQCADMAPLMDLARDHSLAVVEDAAQAHGATYNGQAAGTFGVGCFSFYATKNITAAEGGMITTADEKIADWLRVYRNQGMRDRYEHVGFGINARLSDIHAAIALAQMPELAHRNRTRAANAAVLNDGLGDIDGLVVPAPIPGRSPVWHHYTVRVTPDARRTRSDLASALQADGIGTGLYYPHLAHAHRCFDGSPLIAADAVPRAERYSREILSLPVHPALSESDLAFIIERVRHHLA